MNNQILSSPLACLTYLTDIKLKGDIIIPVSHRQIVGSQRFPSNATTAFIFNQNTKYLYLLSTPSRHCTVEPITKLNREGIKNIVYCKDRFYVLMTEQTIFEFKLVFRKDDNSQNGFIWNISDFKPFTTWSKKNSTCTPPLIISISNRAQHILMIDSNQNVWIYGDNRGAQLIFKRDNWYMNAIFEVPEAIIHPDFTNIKIKDIQTNNGVTALISVDGKCYLMGAIGSLDNMVSFTHSRYCHFDRPYMLFQDYDGMKNKIIIQCALSNNYVVLLTNNYEVFAIGHNYCNQIYGNGRKSRNGFVNEPILISASHIGIKHKNETVVKVFAYDAGIYFATEYRSDWN